MLPHALKITAVALMHMAMDQILRMVALEKLVEAAEALMRQVLHITVALRRRMCYHDIEAVPQCDGRPKPIDPLLHLTLRIHIVSFFIPHRAAEAQDTKPAEIIDAVVDAVTAERRHRIITVVMISMHIKQRCMSRRHQELEVMRIQIAGRQDEVDIPELSRIIIIIELLILFVCNQ